MLHTTVIIFPSTVDRKTEKWEFLYTQTTLIHQSCGKSVPQNIPCKMNKVSIPIVL